MSPPPGYRPPPTGYAPPPPMYVPSSATQAPPPAHDPTRMATLEGNVTTLQNAVDLMAANMAEMMALLRGPNRASSSSIPPLARGPTVDPAPWVPPTHEPEGDIAAAPAPTIIPVPAPHPTRAPAIHLVDFGLPQSTIPAIASLPPMTIPVPDTVMFAPPPVPMPAPATIYTAPPPMGFPASSAPFVVATFQESLSGSALNWFMSLRAEDIPSWTELAKKFVEQYQYNMETPPSFLELSTMEMAEGQKFEDFATNWRSEAAKHFPPICEAQQIQMFHGTLKGAYYSHLMGHKSTFSEMIMAGKQVDLSIKLGRLEGPTKKGEGESSRKTASAATPTGGRRIKEASVNAVNVGHNAPQQYSTPQYRPPASRTPQRTQQAPAPQGQQGGAMQARQPIQFTPLPTPLSHICRQLLAGNMIRRTVPGPSFVPANQDQSLRYEYHSGAPGHTTDNCWKLREEVQKLINSKKISFNAIRPPNVQANPLPDHGSSSGPTINMISICTMREDESQQEGPTPFIIEYVPAEATVGFTGSSAAPAPFIIEVPVREPYQDSKVPWTYEGSIGNLE
ncbi:uncharacterized protein LOC116214420 [Punica granatum]|uniref:Uncharacterized protein LOC116214420 n=1 Tax=Punica granatum TaxID=22663 RepID=A0A6P8EJ69_PUNGR|nr:uncharacterized protein LOC116214420 [Punica granatum]